MLEKRIFSGLQPTGNLHIGNYLGAIQNWVQLQDEFNCVFCIVDLHAITLTQDPAVLKAKTREVAGLLLAAGIDPLKSDVFVQSHISAHSELAWILNCFIPMGWMSRMTQFKEKSKRQKDIVSVGLFDYPALMAADILLYEADYVPVGEDQKQHVELTRDAAQRFNSLYGPAFVPPEPLIPPSGARIMGLDDPTVKMSKSTDKEGHSIHLLDSPEVIVRKIKRATTDSGREITFNPERPGVFNLLTIYQRFTGRTRPELEAEFAGKGYGDLKAKTAEAVVEGLRPLQERYYRLAAEPLYLENILKAGADHVRPRAERILKLAQQKIGLG